MGVASCGTTTDVGRTMQESQSILFQLVRGFDLAIAEMPGFMRSTGISVRCHRKASDNADIFEGTIRLGEHNVEAKVVIGVGPAVGAMISIRVPKITMADDLSEAASAWFRLYWRNSHS